MKVLNILLIVLLTLSLACNAQDSLKIKIKLVKESPKLDSLISSVINYSPNSDILNRDSCLFLYLFDRTIDVGFICNLQKINHKNYVINSTFLNSRSMGYFEFNGYLIFVSADDRMKRFFNYTQAETQFTFLKSKDELLLIKNKLFWTIFYNKGTFNYGVH